MMGGEGEEKEDSEGEITFFEEDEGETRGMENVGGW